MTAKSLHLGKVLKLLALDEGALISALRAELRAERDKILAARSGGGDFYGPFWADAKAHVIGVVNLADQTDFRISSSKQRANLYPSLRDGFLSWLDGVRRQTNRNVAYLEGDFHNHVAIDELELTLKVDNLLAIKIGPDQHRLVYPYFAKAPRLSDKWARIGLWAMSEAFPDQSFSDLEIVDVFAGKGFRGTAIRMLGDEDFAFKARYKSVLSKWDELRAEYGI